MRVPNRFFPWMESGLIFTMVFLAGTRVMAADTTEPFEIGASDVDFYLGVDGLGLGKYEKEVYLDTMIGYGITSKLSYYLGTTLLANEYFGSGSADIYSGIYGNVLDTNHVDLDLFLGAALEGFSDFVFSPAFELNFDVKPDLALFGVYIRTAFPLSSREKSNHSPDDPHLEIVASAEPTAGVYITVHPKHMIHLEYDMTIPFNPLPDEPSYAIGGVAIGYNVIVHDNLELINQVYLDIPQSGELFAVGIMAGFIATVP